jgi:dynein heavy chain
LATGEALRPKFSSTITLKNNRAFDSIGSVYISNIVSALHISAKSSSTVLVASSAAGYLGYAELLEGLKSLFRSITVVVPDLELICENMLMF